MNKFSALLLATGLLGCSIGAPIAKGPDGSTDGSVDSAVATDAPVTPTDSGSACVPCLSGDFAWRQEGGLSEQFSREYITGCSTYHYQRLTSGGAEVGRCSQELLVCPALPVVSQYDVVRAALARPDVQAAFAEAPVLYGHDSRPVDGRVLQVTYNGRTISVGSPCSGAPACREIPAGVSDLQLALTALTAEQFATGECQRMFPTGP